MVASTLTRSRLFSGRVSAGRTSSSRFSRRCIWSVAVASQRRRSSAERSSGRDSTPRTQLTKFTFARPRMMPRPPSPSIRSIASAWRAAVWMAPAAMPAASRASRPTTPSSFGARPSRRPRPAGVEGRYRAGRRCWSTWGLLARCSPAPCPGNPEDRVNPRHAYRAPYRAGVPPSPNSPRRKPGVSAASGFTVTIGSSSGPCTR